MMHSPLFIVLIFLIAVAVAWLLVWPMWQDASLARADVDRLRAVVAQEKEANERLISLASQIAEREEDIIKLEQSISNGRDVATLIAVFEEAATLNGLVLDGVAFSQSGVAPEESLAAASSTLDAVSAELTMAGTYPSFRTFMGDIEQSFPLLDIANISMSHEEEGEGTAIGTNPRFTFTVMLTSYYLSGR
jgi:Tfp pilus assembly protein PilO